MRPTLPELVPAGARRMKLQFPPLAQIKCRYEPVWNECLTLGVFAISGQNLFSLAFLSGWLKLVVLFLWKWEKRFWNLRKNVEEGTIVLFSLFWW